MGHATVIKPGFKHIWVRARYGPLVQAFHDATLKGEIEKGAEILGKIPRSLLGQFHDMVAIAQHDYWAKRTI